MDSATRGRLHDLVLKARARLIREARDLLEGVYGLRADGDLAPAETLPAVGSLEEARVTRARLESHLADEAAAGLAGPDAVARLVKEVAFTHLNRLVAFKMMESRRLMRGTVERYQDANAFKFYLADHPAEQARYDAGSVPQDALGEGPRDTAYRHFLLHQCAEMAEQIRVLFDPDNLPSRLFPRPPALTTLIGWLNDPDLKDAWGQDETIGWVYQYFNEVEKAEVFARLNKGAKVHADEIPAATQLFTPNWVVRALVQNTLGRLWLAIHPDSHLGEELDYLVPLAQEAPAEPLRPVREITLLDPACGTMHFGLVAFDLFAAMYREEIERASQPGWPERPSVADVADIPAAIVEHNLFGIDIDLRAVQLSALTLLLKARSLNRQAGLTDHNLACADVSPLNGLRLGAFLKEMSFGHPLYERLIRGLWARLKDSNQLGSLLRLEADLETLIAGERRTMDRKGQMPILLGFPANQFDTEEGRQEFWHIIEGQVIQAFDEFARQQTETGRDERYFAGEAVKGLRLLDLMGRRYDVVVANPPYMSSRNMSPAMGEYLKKDYPDAKRDLYAAFIARCTEMLAPHGRLGMITQQSFMFISSYEALRGKLLGTAAIESMIHVGPRAFAEIGGEKVNTTLFALRREPSASLRSDTIGTYLRLIKEPDATAKQRGFEQALVRLKAGQPDPVVYRYCQGDFEAIPGAPWVYWITSGLRELFSTLPKLSSVAPPRQGLATADNFRFLRYWWEVGTVHIALRCHDASEALALGKRWIPYMKGGGFRRWWGNQEFVINWSDDGQELYAFMPTAVIRNASFYFHRGVTYSYLTSGTFSARLSPGGFIFDVAGSSLFPPDPLLVLAVMNSTFAAYILKLINPTVNFQVGDLARLPIPTVVSDTIHALVDQAIQLARADSEEADTTYDFVAPPAWRGGLEVIGQRKADLTRVESEIDEEVYRLYGIAPEDRAAIEQELQEPTMGEADEEPGPVTASADEADEDAVGEGLDRTALARRWVSYSTGVALGRFTPGTEGALGRGNFPEETAAALRALAYPEGLAIVETAYPDNLAARVAQALEVMLGEAAAGEVVALAASGKALADYLKGEFFKAHVQQYRKRPVYWLLQSPKKLYSFYAFHEKITVDTLHLLRGSAYLGAAINAARSQQADLHTALATMPQGPGRKRLERELETSGVLLADLEAFDRNIAAVTSETNERGEIVGWRPEIDDGVLLNLAPLRALMPSWAAEPRKAWESLAQGEYDWAHTAMRYWPARVTAQCRSNKSYAIAHSLAEPEPSAIGSGEIKVSIQRKA